MRSPGIPDSVWSKDPNERRRALKDIFFRLPARPLLKFAYYYAWRRGFLDGRAGFTYATLQAIYEYMIACKGPSSSGDDADCLSEHERDARCPVGFGTGGLLRIGRARERQNVLAAALAAASLTSTRRRSTVSERRSAALGIFLARARAGHAGHQVRSDGLRSSLRLAPLQRVARRTIGRFPAAASRRARLRHAVQPARFHDRDGA